METKKSEQERAVAGGTGRADTPVSLVPVPPARESLATLPDGVPSMLWEEAVESERYVAEGPALNGVASGGSSSRSSSGGQPTGR